MIKIKIKNKNLNEVEIKHSSTARMEIYDLFTKFSQESKKVILQVINMPLSEIIYTTKETVNGLPLFMTGYNNKEFSTLVNSWDSQKKQFNKETIDSFLNSKVPILYAHWNEGDQPTGSITIGAIAGAGGIGRQELFRLALNASKIDQNTIHRVIRHELQHITDKINSICRTYYKQLLKDAENIQNIKKIDLNQYIKPSDSIKSGSQIHTDVQDIKDWESFLHYLKHDEEYKTWLSDSIDTIIQYLFSSGLDNEKHMLRMKYKDMLQNPNFSQRRQIKKLASEKGIDLYNADTSDDMAAYYVTTFFNNPKAIEMISRLNKNFQHFLEEMDKVRLKYIRKDLTIGLSKRFKQIYQTL